MPQGPTGLACDTCRSHKKKCDLMRPICSRCRRLSIPCNGSGERKFKFVIEQSTLPYRTRQYALPGPSPEPTNATSRLRQAIVFKVKAPLDLRYHICCRWGPMLVGLPRRLGTNEALDASLAALLARYDETSSRQDQSDPCAPAAQAYNNALTKLRTTLNDSRKALSTETLCAILLLSFCQARFDDQFTFCWSPHGPAIHHLLRVRNYALGEDQFETFLFASLSATVLLQSLANPDVRLEAWEYEKLRQNVVHVNRSDVDTRPWELMIRVAELMSRGRDAISSGTCLETLAMLALEASALELSIDGVLWKMRDRLREATVTARDSLIDACTHFDCLRTYGLMLATSATLLCARRALSPWDKMIDPSATVLCSEALRMGDAAHCYRPSGAIWTVHTLICTWCCTQDPAQKAAVEDALFDYQRDAMGPNASLRFDQLELLERRLSLLE